MIAGVKVHFLGAICKEIVKLSMTEGGSETQNTVSSKGLPFIAREINSCTLEKVDERNCISITHLMKASSRQ